MCKRNGLLVLLILLVLGTNSALANENETQDSAKQLVSPGWENVMTECDDPVVIYALNLIELSSYVGGLIDGAVEVSTSGGDAPGGYTVVTDDDVLSWMGEYPGTFRGELTGALQRRSSGLGYETWLVTMGEQPVSVELTEFKVGNEDDELDQELNITLTPRWDDKSGEGILTDVALDYLNPSGALGRARLSTWIRPEMYPLAIVVQEVESKRQRSRRYFGLYANATVMASSSLPESGALVSIGNITGLQELFGETYPDQDRPLTKLRLGAGWQQEEISVNARLELEEAKYRVFALADGFPAKVSYAAGLDLYLYQELGLAVLLNMDSSWDACLRVGVSDKVRVSDILELEATYLPFGYDWSEGELGTAPYLQFIARIKHDTWAMWYEHTYDDEQVGHGIGITGKLTSNLDLEIHWQRTTTEENYYGLGVVFYME